MLVRAVFVAEGVVLLAETGVHSLGDGTPIRISLAADDEMVSWQQRLVHACELFPRSERMSKMSEEPEEFTGRNIFMSMFNHISWGSKDNEQECGLSANLVSIYAKRFSPGRWSFLGPGSEKTWYSTHDSKPQGEWDRVAELMMFSVPRVHCPGDA